MIFAASLMGNQRLSHPFVCSHDLSECGFISWHGGLHTGRNGAPVYPIFTLKSYSQNSDRYNDQIFARIKKKRKLNSSLPLTTETDAEDQPDTKLYWSEEIILLIRIMLLRNERKCSWGYLGTVIKL